MDGTGSSISPHDLYARLGTAQAPILIDVRKPADLAASDRCVVVVFGAFAMLAIGATTRIRFVA